MYPGRFMRLIERTQASAATLVADVDVLFLTGATGIENIQVSSLPNAQGLIIVPLTGSLVLGVTGNIAVAQTLIVNKATLLVYSQQSGKWYPAALA